MNCSRLIAGKTGEDYPLVTVELRTLPVDDSWYTLGQALGISHEELDRIQQGEANPFKCKTKMFKIWIREDPTATWAKIATALEEIGKSELATEVRNQYGIRGDTAPSSSEYSSAESSLSWNKATDEVEKDGLKRAKLNVVREFLIKLMLMHSFLLLLAYQ